jgi:hypothetical protein
MRAFKRLLPVALPMGVYSAAYLPMLASLLAGGLALQGHYAFLRYAFDLVSAALGLGLSQSIFKAVQTLPLTRIFSFHNRSVAALLLVGLAGLAVAGRLQALGLLCLAAAAYALLLVRRLALLIDNRTTEFQLLTGVFPVSLALLLLAFGASASQHLGALFLAAVAVMALATWAARRRSGGAAAAPAPQAGAGSASLRPLLAMSGLAFVYQLTQFLFPLAMALVIRWAGGTEREVGVFSIAYAIAVLVYAPATVFGANIVGHLYQTSGAVPRSSVVRLGLLGLAGSVALGLLMLLAHGLQPQLFPVYSLTLVACIALFPLLAAARLPVPLAIWRGDHFLLLVSEACRLLLGLALFANLPKQDFEHMLVAITLVELMYGGLCLAYLHFGRPSRA